MRIKPYLFYGFLIVFAIWVLGICVFGLYAYLLQFSALPSADAVVVLTGGADRLQKGFALFEKQKAPLLFITGVNEHVSPQMLAKAQQAELTSPVSLDYSADNTFENALATKKWSKGKNIKSILLVTSFYHMPRSLFEFSKQLPDVQIYPVPVFAQQNVHWTRTRSAWLIFVEYNKFIVRFIQFQIKRILL